MAGFLGDIFGALTGQKSMPQQTIIPTDQLLGQQYGLLNSQVAPGLVGFNQALAPGLTDVQLGVTNQIDPSILANYRGANKSILDQLNLGTNLDPALQAEITRGLLQTNAGTGFGASAGGTGNILYQTAIDKQNILRQRQQDALGAGTTGLQESNRIYNPQYYTGLGENIAQGIGADIRGVQAAQDQYANLAADIKAKNFSNLLNTGGRILGGIAGGILGAGNPMAIQAGQGIGGSLFQGGGVAGQEQSQGQQQGGGFGSLLSGLQGIFGGGGQSQGAMRNAAFEQGGIPLGSYG